jgi:hypothetical protein
MRKETIEPNRAFEEKVLFVLELNDATFDRILDDETLYLNRTVLAHAVDAIHCLQLSADRIKNDKPELQRLDSTKGP